MVARLAVEDARTDENWARLRKQVRGRRGPAASDEDLAVVEVGKDGVAGLCLLVGSRSPEG